MVISTKGRQVPPLLATISSSNIRAASNPCHRSKRGDAPRAQYVGAKDESSAAGNAGEQFDASKEAFDFILGAGQATKGWGGPRLEGILVGETRAIVLPPEEAYGNWAPAPRPRPEPP